MEKWTIQNSSELYGIEYWGDNYFRINENGHVEVGINDPEMKPADLYQLTHDLVERGLRLPLLIRFSDIVRHRIQLINRCFANAIKDYNYKGQYLGVYPIKVNQERHLVEEIIQEGKFHRLGLECGSKPELLITLAVMDNPDALIICNGFKDFEYVETALLAQKLGKHIVVVVDRIEEFDFILNAAKKVNVKPHIGFRCKLNSQGTGRWVESSGARSKFGLTPSEIVECVDRLEQQNMLDCLELLHFHIGSQIPSIQSIKSSIKEGAQFYTELSKLAPNLRLIDVGGGLGVNYDGSGRSDSSTNYNEQEYANDVVSIIQSICEEKSVAHPDIVTESGRALVAHSSILIFDVLGSNELKKHKVNFEVSDKDSRIVQELYEIWNQVTLSNFNEYYNDLIEKKRDSLQLFTYGVLDLRQRAKAEDLYWASVTKMYYLIEGEEEFEDIYWELANILSDTYFCNFSVFQSLPDSWALNQVFPVMPIHRLKEEPDNTALLVDLTCDSDGKIDNFIDIDAAQEQRFLEVHNLKKEESYLIGVFLTGAYQEILGDMHNLFGDTDAVHISLDRNGYNVDHVVQGDTVSDVLTYVSYHKHELIELVRKAAEQGILKGELEKSEAKLLLQHYEQGLAGYTYFEDGD